MNSVVVLGTGGREHALAMTLLKSRAVNRVIVMPGNPGMKKTVGVEVLSIKTLPEVLSKLKEINPTLVVIGPETYLDAGWSDQIRALGLAVFGPSQKVSALESSKVFAKDFMNRHQIPTAKSVSANNYDEALEALKNWKHSAPPVVKCDALAAGKGVVVAQTMEEAREASFNFMKKESFSVHSERLVFEERLEGREMSLFVLSDGKNYQVLGHACDYKRLHDDHKGPNTGGMGCVIPDDFPSSGAMNYIGREIVERTFKGLKDDGLDFQGVLFIGLMVSEDKAQVIEYNVRFGDPETQVLLPTLEVDLYDLLLKCATGTLGKSSLTALPTKGLGIHVVLVSEGYPDLEAKGMLLDQMISLPDSIEGLLTYAGVKESDNGILLNSGGRVLGLTVIAPNLKEASSRVYRELGKIHFEGVHYRRDIGVF